MELLAVYGTLKEGFGNHRWMPEGSRKLGETRIAGWRMYSLGAFPYISRGVEADDVMVEVYEVPNLESTDRLEGYQDGFAGFYDRTQVRTEFGNTWVYFFPEAEEDRHLRITDGVWGEYD